MTGKRLIQLQRLRNSRNGNPRWHMQFDDGTAASTKVDAMFAYSMDVAWEGRMVDVLIENGIVVEAQLAGGA